jgi:predicted component of type VI protein secretion system
MNELNLHWQWGSEHHTQSVKGGGQLTIGRREDCDVTLGVNTVSRLHGLVYSEQGEFRLRNLSRVNTVRVNHDKQLAHQQSITLQNNDVFQIGPVQFTVEISAVESTYKIRCANCHRVLDYDPTGFCPWCGMALAAGQTLIDL